MGDQLKIGDGEPFPPKVTFDKATPADEARVKRHAVWRDLEAAHHALVQRIDERRQCEQALMQATARMRNARLKYDNAKIDLQRELDAAVKDSADPVDAPGN